MLIVVFHSYTNYLFTFLLLGVCVLMLLAPLYTWKYHPAKSLTKRLLIALFLIPVSLYFLIDTFSTKDVHDTSLLFLNADKPTDSIMLNDDDHIKIADKHAVVSALGLRGVETKKENVLKAEIVEEENDATYQVVSVSELVDKLSEKRSERAVFQP